MVHMLKFMRLSLNFQPWLDWYLNTTGQRLVGGNAAAPAGGHGSADATSGASDGG